VVGGGCSCSTLSREQSIRLLYDVNNLVSEMPKVLKISVSVSIMKLATVNDRKEVHRYISLTPGGDSENIVLVPHNVQIEKNLDSL
jgi:hypothetical protein